MSAEPVRTEPAPERTRIPVQQPRPQQSRPVQARQPRTVDPSDPFAEWEKKPQAPGRSAAAGPERRSPRRRDGAGGQEPAGRPQGQ